jgi:hypothetical protein
MKKRSNSRETDFNPEDRKRNLNFKRKKQRDQERNIDHKKMSNLKDFDEYE